MKLSGLGARVTKKPVDVVLNIQLTISPGIEDARTSAKITCLKYVIQDQLQAWARLVERRMEASLKEHLKDGQVAVSIYEELRVDVNQGTVGPGRAT
jgi:hypothetical protein